MDGDFCSRSDKIGDFISVIDRRTLARARFLRNIEAVRTGVEVRGFGSVADWIADTRSASCTAILYNTEGRPVSDAAVTADIRRLAVSTEAPVVVLSPVEDVGEMIGALDLGAMGYIPEKLGMEAIPGAIALTWSSMVFLPVRALLAMREAVAGERKVLDAALKLTARQSTVADALRRGKPNKLIAYELDMSESTVKFHVRNIMNKLGARNRTEAGYKLNAALREPSEAATVA